MFENFIVFVFAVGLTCAAVTVFPAMLTSRLQVDQIIVFADVAGSDLFAFLYAGGIADVFENIIVFMTARNLAISAYTTIPFMAGNIYCLIRLAIVAVDKHKAFFGTSCFPEDFFYSIVFMRTGLCRSYRERHHSDNHYHCQKNS